MPLLRQVLFTDPWILLVFPVIHVVAAVVFWQTQIVHYNASTEGVVLMWLSAGLVFGVVMLTFYIAIWNEAWHDTKPAEKRLEVLWVAGTQIVTLGLMTVYSIIVHLILILRHHIYPVQVLDVVIMTIFAATSVTVYVVFRKRRGLKNPAARFWLATGAKVAPQVWQAVGFAVYGSLGLHWVTLVTVVTMTVFRYIAAFILRRRHATDNALYGEKTSKIDLVAVGAIAVGWGIGQSLWPHKRCSLRTNEPAPGTIPGFFSYRTA